MRIPSALGSYRVSNSAQLSCMTLTRFSGFQYPPTMQKSVLVYTVHKAGSSFLNLLLRQIARRYDLQHVTENRNADFDAIVRKSWKQFIKQHPQTACFGPIRGSNAAAIFPDDLDRYSIVLHLRDPRDVLTSMYYSFAYSHAVSPGRVEIPPGQREHWRGQGVDQFVREFAPPVAGVYQNLMMQLLGRPNVILTHYEDMVLDYPNWLHQFLAAFDHLPIPSIKLRHRFLTQFVKKQKIRRQLLRKHRHAFSVDAENVNQHKRKVVPGDHAEKLSPATIAILDKTFGDYFRHFGARRVDHAA